MLRVNRPLNRHCLDGYLGARFTLWLFPSRQGGHNPFDDDNDITSGQSEVSRIHIRDPAQACNLVTEVINLLEIRFSADFITGPNVQSSSLVSVKITQRRRIRPE